jgi:hypothetical protein
MEEGMENIGPVIGAVIIVLLLALYQILGK